MKHKKLKVFVKIIVIFFCVVVFLLVYMSKKHVYESDYSTFNTDITGNGKEISAININEHMDLKIMLSANVNEGSMDISLYYIPQDHLMYKIRHMSESEIAQIVGTEAYKTELQSTEGLECVFNETISQSGYTEICTDEFKTGLYALSMESSENADISGSIKLHYVRYNWMKLMEKIKGYEYTPY